MGVIKPEPEAADAAPFSLPQLAFALDELEPHISERTLTLHYGQHHKGYVDKLNDAIVGTDFEGSTLEEIIKRTASEPDKKEVFNNAAQVWNHTFFWRSIRSGGGGSVPDIVASALSRSLGGVEAFRRDFKEAATGEFGSGWAWLVADSEGELSVESTSDAGNPMVDGKVPLLTCDVWEHAYYLDYQNRRDDFVDRFVDQLINWDFVEANLRNIG